MYKRFCNNKMHMKIPKNTVSGIIKYKNYIKMKNIINRVIVSKADNVIIIFAGNVNVLIMKKKAQLNRINLSVNSCKFSVI